VACSLFAVYPDLRAQQFEFSVGYSVDAVAIVNTCKKDQMQH
jgi:hypothetical protein